MRVTISCRYCIAIEVMLLFVVIIIITGRMPQSGKLRVKVKCAILLLECRRGAHLPS